MKANELMIGDWLLINDEPRKVELVTKKKVGYHIKQNECKMHYARLCEVEPITITKEILEKIGFLDLPQTRGNVLEVDDKYINYDINNGYLFIIGRDEDLIDVRNICFIHELQHTLRLCKIDREIKL